MRKLNIHGVEFRSLKEVCEVFKLRYTSARKLSDAEIAAWCLIKAKPSEAAIDKMKKAREQRMKYVGVVQYKNREFASVDEAAEAFGLDRYSIIRAIRRGSAALKGDDDAV